MPRLAGIRRRHSRSSVFVSFDPRTLTPGVCPFAGTPGLQPQSWINENENFLILSAIFLLLRSQTAADGGEYGSASPRLSLADVTRLVLENNPAIKESEHHWR